MYYYITKFKDGGTSETDEPKLLEKYNICTSHLNWSIFKGTLGKFRQEG